MITRSQPRVLLLSTGPYALGILAARCAAPYGTVAKWVYQCCVVRFGQDNHSASLPLINAGFCCFSHPRQTDCTTSQLIESTNYANTALPVPMSGNITCRCGMCNAVIVSGATYGPRFSHTEKKTEIFSHFEMRERMTCCNRRWCSEHVSEEGLSRGEAGDTDQCLQTYWHQNCSCRFPAEVLARYCCRGEVAPG